MIEIEQSCEFNSGTAAPPVVWLCIPGRRKHCIIMYLGISSVVGPVCSGWLYSVDSCTSVEAVS